MTDNETLEKVEDGSKLKQYSIRLLSLKCMSEIDE